VASCARITTQQCVPFCSDVFHSPRIPSVSSPLSGGLGHHRFPTPGEWKCSDLKCIRKPTRSRLRLTRWPIQDGPRVRWISPIGKEKVYWVCSLPVLKSQVLSSEWNTEWVREDASSDCEDGEDDELPCVIGESDEDCVWEHDQWCKMLIRGLWWSCTVIVSK